MTVDRTIQSFQADIICAAVKTLGRVLTAQEQSFITQRCGFIGLDVIHETVTTANRQDLERYLNSK